MAKNVFPLAIPLVAYDKVTGVVRKVRKELRPIGDDLEHIKKGAGGLATVLGESVVGVGLIAKASAAAVVAMGGGVVFLTEKFSKASTASDVLSKSLGVNASWLQEIQFAGRVAGVSTEATTGAVRGLQKSIADAATGKGGKGEIFRALGIEIQTVDGFLRSTDEILPDVADKLGRLRDQTARTHLAQELFGGSGAALLPLLGQGAAKIAEYQAEAKRLGGVIGGEAAKGTAEYRRQMEGVKFAAAGVRNELAVALMPAVSGVAKATSDWILENKPLIKQFADEFAAGLPEKLEKLGGLASKLTSGIGWLAEKGMKLSQEYGIGKTVLNAFAGVMLAKAVPSALQLTGGLFGAGRSVLSLAGGLGGTLFPALATGTGLLAKFWKVAAGGAVAGTGIGLVVAGLVLLEEKTGLVSAAIGAVWDGIVWGASKAWELVDSLTSKLGGLIFGDEDESASVAVASRPVGPLGGGAADRFFSEQVQRSASSAAAAQPRDVRLRVEATGGARMKEVGDSGVDLELRQGPAFG